MPPIYECLVGPTEAYIRGQNYRFDRDAEGRYTCMVIDDAAIACFKDHPTYREVTDGLATSAATVAKPINPVEPAAPVKRTRKQAAAEAQIAGVAITTRMTLEEIDAAIKDHQDKLAAELAEEMLNPTEPVDPDGKPADPNAVPSGGEGDTGEPSGSADSSGVSGEPDASTDPIGADTDPDVNDDD